jgi:hypothetical protein
MPILVSAATSYMHMVTSYMHHVLLDVTELCHLNALYRVYYLAYPM